MATVELKSNDGWKDFIQTEYSIIDCYGDNCVACVVLEPIYDAIADEMAEIAFGRVNITHYPEIADTYGIDSMPTLLYLRNGQLVHKSIGSMEKEEVLANIAKMLYQ